jgi:hypothetical protein
MIHVKEGPSYIVLYHNGTAFLLLKNCLQVVFDKLQERTQV